MEHTLRAAAVENAAENAVLILVLVEHTLRETDGTAYQECSHQVLILVLVEHTLRGS